MDSVLGFAGTLDRRYFSTIWLPVQVFALALVLSVLDWRALLAGWSAAPVGEQVVVAVGTLALTTAAAYVLSVVLPSVTRLYEGRWHRALDPIANRLRGRQTARRARGLAGQRRDETLATFPPPGHDVMPTALGNVLRSAELHSWVRYRLDSVVSWPRLFECLPERIVRQLAAEKAQLDLILVLSFLTALYAPIVGVANAVDGAWLAAVTCFAAGIILSRICYMVAVPAAVSYGLIIRSAYDVHRFRMLDALDWDRPTSWSVERRQWQAIAQLWLRGIVSSREGAEALGYPSERRPDDGFWRRIWVRVSSS
jgi:hypothetical protein